MRVTDEMVERSMLILFPHNRALSVSGRDKLKEKVRASLEDAISHAAGQEVVAWVVIDRDVGNTVNAVLPDQEEWAKRIASKDAHYFAAPAYLHPAVARSEGEG